MEVHSQTKAGGDLFRNIPGCLDSVQANILPFLVNMCALTFLQTEKALRVIGSLASFLKLHVN